MQSSDAAPPTRRVVGRVVAVLLGALGLSLVGSPLFVEGGRGDGGSTFFPVVGTFLLACAVVVWLTRGTGTDAVRRTALGDLDGEPALLVELRPVTPLVMLVLGAAGAGLFLFAMLAVGLGHGGLLFAPFLLLFLVQVPDAAQALLRRPRLALGSATVDLRGWGLDARLAWEDVTRVHVEGAGSRWSRLVIEGRPDAASWRCRTRRILVPLDRRPSRPQVSVLLSALDEPARVQTLAADLAARDPQERRVLVDANGVAFLNGTM